MSKKFQQSPPDAVVKHKTLDLAALRCLSSPTRIDIIGAMRALGPLSIRELATYLNRSADGLYYHVRHMMRAGLVVQAGRRAVWRRYEAIYRLTAEEFAHGSMASSAHYRRATIQSARALLALAHRYYAAAIGATAANPEMQEIMEFYMATARLTPASARKLKKQLRGMFYQIARNEGSLGERMAVTVMMTPVIAKRKVPVKTPRKAPRRR